ncbi:PRA1 family protein F4 [Quercus suber]|nr:PRA1 family protein F4-like [Quercus suber]POE64512.1 pra1 family protein f4 [Quercus suber]
MASYGTMQRPGTSSTSPPSAQPDDSKDSTQKKRNDSMARYLLRFVRNLRYFGLYYALILWNILFISFVPWSKVSLILLVVNTIVTSLHLTLLLRALPISVVLHRIIDKRLVVLLSLLAMVSGVELILTRAAIRLLIILTCGIQILLVHAFLRISDDPSLDEEACAAGELVPLVHGKTGDVDIESQASV